MGPRRISTFSPFAIARRYRTRTNGRAMTYVLVHDGGATARFWDRLLPHLDRPVLAVDLPGRNDKPADPTFLLCRESDISKLV